MTVLLLSADHSRLLISINQLNVCSVFSQHESNIVIIECLTWLWRNEKEKTFFLQFTYLLINVLNPEAKMMKASSPVNETDQRLIV